MKKILCVFLYFTILSKCFSQDTSYVYSIEHPSSLRFEYSFNHGMGYIEIWADQFYDYLLKNQITVKRYGEDELFRVLQGNFARENYKDFVTIHMNGCKYLLLESQDKIVSVLVPLLESAERRWYTFWGISKDLNLQGYIISHVGSTAATGETLVEEIDGQVIKYKSMAGQNYLSRDNRWVEGVDGYGIGESIIMRSYNDRIGLIFLNGFIAPWDFELYYQNSRVKQIELEYDGLREIINIEDTPNPQVFFLKKPTTDLIKITILDVYPGTKYQDTAISNILFIRRSVN